METKSATVGAFTSETLLLFPNREGAIDRLVGIYKDVVHKTGVSLTACFSFGFCYYSIFLIFNSPLCLNVGLSDRERLRQTGAS